MLCLTTSTVVCRTFAGTHIIQGNAMTHTPPPATPPAAPSPMNRIAGIVAGIVAVISIGIYLFNTFTLPGCDSTRTTDALRSIAREKKVEIKSIFDVKTVTSSRNEITCTANLDTPEEQLAINYTVNWRGWSAYVQITSATTRGK